MVRRRPELVVAAGLFVLLMAVSGRYGWFIDEMYFIRAGAEPAWGYPDQPALNPVALHALYSLGGGRMELVRLIAALASCTAVALAGSMAGLLGGGPAARLVAAVLWAASGTALVTGHLFVTGTFDVLATAAMCWFLVRAVTAADPRWLVPAGLALAFGLTNKMLVGVAAACLVVALLVIGPRGLLWSRWALLAAVPPVLAFLPYAYWQATHGFPQSGVAEAIAALPESRPVGQLIGQATMLAAAALPLFIGGLIVAFRTRGPGRVLALGYLLMLALVMVMRGRGYYTCGLGPALAALGGIAGERWLARSGRSPVPRRAAVAALLVVAFAADVACCLPVIPVRRLEASGAGKLNPMILEEVGWPALARTVAGVWQSIPAAERDQAVIFTSNYSTAGAIDVHGREFGLPPAFSGHVGYAQWGPPTGTGPVVLIGFDSPEVVSTAFRDCRPAATIDNGVGLSGNAQGRPVLLCAGTTRPWADLWPSLVHYDLGYRRSLPDLPAP